MQEQIQSVPEAAARLLGDPHPLVARLGSPGGLATLPAGTLSGVWPVTDASSFRLFLGAYAREVLVPVELPAIQEAQAHTTRYEARELLALDQRLSREPRMTAFGEASRAVGRRQLHRLLPLRDQRIVRRYYDAVARGEAEAWHVLVYGMVLGLFSLPLRQGLLNYARQTLTGFVDAAASSLELTEEDGGRLLDEALGGLPAAVEQALRPHGPPRLLVD
ncbi:MAG: hypothetical protein FJ387_16200 [Verrucomicrobia bacterium]|nr:hypothetical protein [Verrucomicrobiota bacterium]